jgi:alkaline phosphatase D
MIRAHGPEPGHEDHAPPAGEHGYDPYEMHSMRAIFFAEGPDIKRGIAVKPFENINVFPLVTKILDLQGPGIDGSLNVLSGVLKDQQAGKPDQQ